MPMAISEEKGTLGRNRYIEKHHIHQTIKIICDPSEINLIYRYLLMGGDTGNIIRYGRSGELYYGTIAQYANRYLWKLEDFLPGKGAGVRNMFQ